MPAAYHPGVTDDPAEHYWFDDDRQIVGERLPSGGTALYHLALADGRVVVTKVVVERPTGITGRTLRLSPGAAVEVFLREADTLSRAFFEVAAQHDLDLGLDPTAPSSALRLLVKGRSINPWAQAIDRYMKRGLRRGDRRARLAITAALYVDALQRRVRAPNEDVARRQRRTAALVRDDLKRARDAGLLTDAPGRGVSGGELTKEAERILEGLQP